MPNEELRETLFKVKLRQYQLAKKSRVKLWRLNRHINHGYPLKEKERSAIVRTLNRILPPWSPYSVDDIFKEDAR